jgi:hypothetical protein
MTWIPPSDLGPLLDKVPTRARENAVGDFAALRKRIESEQAGKAATTLKHPVR